MVVIDKEEVAAKVTELVQPYLVAQGVELVEVEFQRPRQGRAVLRLFVDRAGGITLEEITRISRVAGDLLDVHDFIAGPYNLEVSSPGLTRALKKPTDYERYQGRLVRLTTHRPFRGRQVHRGILRGLEEGEVWLEEGGEMVKIPFQEVAKARLDIDMKILGKEA